MERRIQNLLNNEANYQGIVYVFSVFLQQALIEHRYVSGIVIFVKDLNMSRTQK